MFSGIFYSSVWFVTLAVYYILLAVMRASLLHYVRKTQKNKISEWRRYRLCGISLLFMNIALTGIVILVVRENSGFAYPGMLIYIMAMYAFYATITAVRNVAKFRRYGSPVLSAAKAVSLTAALVSMLSLETAMLTQFGTADDPLFRQVNRTIPILFMSAKDDLPSKQKGFQLGIDDYMVKPIELDD